MGWSLSFVCLVLSTNMFVKTAEVESVGPRGAKTGVQPSWITSLVKHHQFQTHNWCLHPISSEQYVKIVLQPGLLHQSKG